MKKIFSFTKKKKHPSSSTPDNGSVLSVGYELKDKDLGKVHKAASVGDLAKLKQLAKKNDINQLDKENRTALHIACANGHVEVVQFLVESKAKLNLCDNQNRSALMKAVQGQHEHCVCILLENHAEPNLVDINGNTALHLASNIPSISTAVLLLQHGAEINAQNKEGFTPLTVAVREDHIEMAEFLLKEAADLNLLDQGQRSPLIIAAGNGQINMVRLLLQFDADITVKDSKGWSADDYAVMNGHHPCSLLIIQHGTQRNDGASLSHQGPSNKKKKIFGSPSQDIEAGFSLGGPATDKDDEDNSQSESLSRVSKSAADEWASSEDDDESIVTDKKPLKVNLSKMIASKKGEAPALRDTSLSGTESEPESENRVQSIPSLPKAFSSRKSLQHPVDPSPVSFIPKAPQMASTPLPNYRKRVAEQGKSKHSEQPSSSKTRSDSQEGNSTEDSEEEDGEEEEEEDEEEEEEEEDDDDDDDDDDNEDDEEVEEEEEEDDDENENEESEEEDGSVEEDNDNFVATVKANTEFEDAQKPNGALKIVDSADTQSIHGDASEKDKTETQKTDLTSPAGTSNYAMAATLNVEGDCVVSAIRVESKFSDEDDSLGKESLKSLDRNILSNQGSTGCLTPSKHCPDSHSPSKMKKEEFEKERDNDDPWNDSDEEEDNQTGKFIPSSLLANQSNVLSEVGVGHTDSLSDNKDAGCDKKEEKRRSSWGSSLEDSDIDVPRDNEKDSGAADHKSDVQAPDLLPEAASLHSKTTLPTPNEDRQDTSWDSSSPVAPSPRSVSPEQVIDEHKSFLEVCSTSSPLTKNRPGRETVEDSDWDSSENNVQNDASPITKCEVVSSVTTANQVGQHHESSGEEDKESIERNSNDPSIAVSPVPEDENTTRNQMLDKEDDDDESVESLHEKGQSDSGEEKDNSWDDEDESDESVKQKAMNMKDDEAENFDGKKEAEEVQIDSTEKDEDDGVVPQSFMDENDEPVEDIKTEKEKLVGVEKHSPGKDDESSVDSDSKDEKLQYDFTSAKVKMTGVGEDSDDLCQSDKSDDEHNARLTAYVPLENTSFSVTQTRQLSDEEPIREKTFSSPSTKDDATAGQPNGSDGSDEVLPQTDIDDVDVDSPDETENPGMRGPELRDTEQLVIQKEDSTEDEDDHDKEEERDEEEDDEGDISDESDQPEEIRGSLDAVSSVPETDVSKDKKRDFLSELGLEKGEEEQDSLDSESHSEKSTMSTAEQKEDIKEIGNNSNDDNGDNHDDDGDTIQKETEKAKWEPLSVLSKLEGDIDQKTDLMEELGLGDVDDLEDASDWDSASTASKRTLPGRRMASPGLEEFPECSSSPVKVQAEDTTPSAPLTPERSSEEKQPITPSQTVPQPQPRARKMVLQKPESEEESDWESDKISSSSSKITKTDNQLQNAAEPLATVGPGSPELSPLTRDSENCTKFEEHQDKEKDDAVDRRESDLYNSGLVSSGRRRNDEFRDQCGPEETVDECADVPWEKRYEKLWVEVEKREVKSTFKNVAGELKERFGELFNSRCAAENVTEEQATTGTTSADEDSSDEEEGEIIIRPKARARSTVLVTIPEQRESGLEDSATESTDNSLCEDRMQDCEQPARNNSIRQKSDALTNDDLKSSSPPLTSITHTTEALTDGHAIATCADDHSSLLKDEAKQHRELIWKDTSADLNAAEKNNSSSEEDLVESTVSRLPSLSRRSASAPGVSDEELEEDMERFKLEVGVLKFVFLHLERDGAQLQKEVGKEATKITVEVQKSSASWDTGGSALEEGTEKPETELGSRQTEAVHQEQQPAATESTNRAPVQLHLPVQQICNSIKQEKQAVEATLQLELVRGAQHCRAPQTNTHVNGDPLSVFDDSSLSEVSDDEGRVPTSGQQKSKNSEEVEMAEDFDELTQSSDTATDDIDSPTSGYRHASLLIQNLDSASLDSRSMVKLQNIFHEYERSIQKARSRHGYLTDKVSQLEMEKVELKSSLEEVKDLKSVLERNQLELQTEVTNIKFQLKQEQENRRNATMMYNTTRDKLKRTEEQHELEVQERQKVELTLRNLELEMRILVSNIKQLEEDHSETQRLLAQERSARTLQENLLNSHLRKQQEIEEENKRNMSKSNEALSQLTEASDRERELLQQVATLQEQLTVLRTDLERSHANSSLKESHLLEENEALKEQLEDVRRDLKLNSEALTQTVYSSNNQLSALKSELAVTTTRLENERQIRETLEAEVESTRTRLVGAVKEAELCLAAHTDTEKALLREKEEHQRLKDRLTGESASQREAVSSLSQKLAKAESRANSMENEVHRVTMQLTEKGLLLEVLQREKDQAAARIKELEASLHSERDLVSRAGARQEATQERLAQAQSEGMLLRQQLEEAQNKGVAKERAVTDAQERFSDILSKLRSDCEERVQLVEDRNKELASRTADLRDQIYKLEEEKNERETSVRQLQQELADSLKKLSMSEASLEVNTRYRNDLEEEKARLLKDLDRLRGKLEESEDQYVQAERRINGLKNSLDEREKELTTTAQKLQEALSASAASHTTIKQLEEAVQRLEIENARLEAAAKQQSNKIDALQKGAQEAAMVRGRLEDLVTNLQSSKMTLEDQLSREVQKQSMLSHTAQDSQALWEEELKSRSKLGLRLAELEKEKGELNTQMEIEKKKAKKTAEQKKAVDTRLDQEMKRNTELQKEMYRLRTLLKTAKKKLRDQDVGGAEFVSPMSSLRMDQGRHSQAEGAFGRIKDKVDDLQAQLEKETSRRSQLEKVNGELKDQVASLKSLSRSHDQVAKSKRQLEEEVLDLRRRMEAVQVEQSQVEQFRRDAEDRARQEIQQKLEQVNLFLQSQAASQEALDQIKAANESNLRSQLEQKIRELEGELGRARTTQQDSLNQRDSTLTELERYRQLYTEELRLRKSLAAKLDRANSRLGEANSKLLNERSRSLITSNITNGSLGGPSLDLGSLGSPANYGATLGPLNRSLGLGISLLSPVTEGHNSRVEDYLAKMQSELDRNISKELSNATADLDVASARMSPVGSASRVELDPVSRATQQYLEVLKKNNMI